MMFWEVYHYLDTMVSIQGAARKISESFSTFSLQADAKDRYCWKPGRKSRGRTGQVKDIQEFRGLSEAFFSLNRHRVERLRTKLPSWLFLSSEIFKLLLFQSKFWPAIAGEEHSNKAFFPTSTLIGKTTWYFIFLCNVSLCREQKDKSLVYGVNWVSDLLIKLSNSSLNTLSSNTTF